MSNIPRKLFSDSIDPVYRTKSEEVFLVRIEAKPNSSNEEALDIAGAFVNCWVNADDLKTAELESIKYIQDSDWTPSRFDHWELVCRECYQDEEFADSLQAVEDSFEEGISGIFYTWPHDAPDAHEAEQGAAANP